MLPELGTVIAIFELEHSAKANVLRKERNELERINIELQEARNTLAESNNTLFAANNMLAEENKRLQSERNEHLAEIAKHMQRPQTEAEINAIKLRNHLGSPIIALNSDNSRWGGGPLIAEVSDNNIVAFFHPAQRGSQAFVIYADCKDLEVIEIAQGACPLQVKVNKRYGNFIPLGEITKWEDHRKSAAMPVFDRGPVAYHIQFGKQGSSETRTLFIYTSKDGTNLFQLEASTGEQFVGNNKEVSIRFLSKQVDYLSDGFQRGTVRTGESHYPLFIS
jgi:hypothetical protein